jgi:hypothetical protein
MRETLDGFCEQRRDETARDDNSQGIAQRHKLRSETNGGRPYDEAGVADARDSGDAGAGTDAFDASAGTENQGNDDGKPSARQRKTWE